MKRLELLYLVVTLGILGVGIAVPYIAHRQGSDAVPGWTWLVRPGALSAAHAFLESDCEGCHTAHEGPTADKCIACHANETALLERAPTTFHARLTDCRGCHMEHLGQHSRPVLMNHERLVTLAQQGQVQELKAATSSDSQAPGPPPHAHISTLEARLDCNACHAAKDPHRSMLGKDCAQCHGTQAWSIAEFVHPPAGSRECAQCHQAPPSHYMGHFEMVSRTVAGQHHADVSQCFMCHKTTAWNDIRGVGFYKHH